ncbi:gtp-binding protein rab11 [Pelomyxa schiedti]|nr:gtp-binding protein rab11 [Pelomyxa schiedti]
MTASAISAKIVMIGNSGVGKTSVGNMFVHGAFSSDYAATIGASFMSKNIAVADIQVKLQIWDTAGQERYRAMTPMYYRGSQAAIVTFDLTDADSYHAVQGWIKDLQQHITGDIIIVIVGNKLDAPSRIVTKAEAMQFVQTLPHVTPIQYFETSAKTGEGVNELFAALGDMLTSKIRKSGPAPAPTPKGTVHLSSKRTADSNPDGEKKECNC